MTDERSPNAIDRKLGQRVRARRLEIGMSQETLAARLDVTFQQVQKYEKGVNRIAASRLLAISTALQWPVAKFYEGLADYVDNPVADAVTESLASPDGARMAALFARIKAPRIRRQVISLTEAMAEEAR